MNIALITDTYVPQVNGVTTVVGLIAHCLPGLGVNTAVAAPRYPRASMGETDELRIRSVPFPPYPAIWPSIAVAGAVRRFLDAFAPDVVHVATEGPVARHGGPARPLRLPVWPRGGRDGGRGSADARHAPTGLLLVPLAITIAASRVALRVHHVPDVVAGAALGLAGALGDHHLLF